MGAMRFLKDLLAAWPNRIAPGAVGPPEGPQGLDSGAHRFAPAGMEFFRGPAQRPRVPGDRAMEIAEGALGPDFRPERGSAQYVRVSLEDLDKRPVWVVTLADCEVDSCPGHHFVVDADSGEVITRFDGGEVGGS